MLCALASSPVEAGEAKVTTRSGVVVGTEHGTVRSFKNIPYAAPPIGDRRWAPPAAPLQWSGERPADQFGPPCAQLDFARVNEGRRISGEGFDVFLGVPLSRKGTEDCLHLNVWAPVAAKKAPVMVFIYGGGGSADIPYWDGAGFAEGGVVLVNFNYRNLTMGKFAHPALTRAAAPMDPLGRYDVMDQMAALRWVRHNIEAFGGDPDNVTIFGQSAGGAAVLQLMTVPSAKGLFHKAIAQSPNGWWTAATHEENERLGAILATKAGLPGAGATLKQLRATPVSAFPQIGHFTYDGRLMPLSPTEAFRAGRVIDVPLLIGWTSDDGSSLRFGAEAVLAKTPPTVMAAYAVEGKTGDALAYGLYTDSHVGAPARWIAKRTSSGAPSFLYHFSYVRPAARPTARGATHGSELPFVFNSWSKISPEQKPSAEEEAVTRLMQSCWISFAQSGRPSCTGAPSWPPYTGGDDRLMELNTEPQVRRDFRKAQLDVQEAAMGDTLAAQRQTLDMLLSGEW